MFKTLQKLARESRILISIEPEGDLMRVSITSLTKGPETTAKRRPLSLVASAQELDLDFAQAIEIWSRQHRTLLQQVTAFVAQEGGEGYSSPGRGNMYVGSKHPFQSDVQVREIKRSEWVDSQPSAALTPRSINIAHYSQDNDEMSRDIELSGQMDAKNIHAAATNQTHFRVGPGNHQPLTPSNSHDSNQPTSTSPNAANHRTTFSDLEF
ncbi:PRTRC system protein E [Herbaspirillum rubrisubalbicans]|uniref:PRTRC system protein E n=1 Tax=Herbaspirillum rubrisubalbicans TaxID=80842 RepID=UPI000382855E|nr:PRTRC system protein E [Herbaspirillum rubrisubalbicans]